MTGLEIRSAAAVGLLYVVRMLGLFMVLPVLPLVAEDLDGSTPLMIGLALGIYGFSQACLQIPLGLLSDRIGRKKVIFGGLLVFLAGSLVAAAADSIYGIVVGRFLQGCGAIASTLLALVSDVTRVEHRAKAMAIVGISIATSFGLALILGPLVNNLGGLSAVFLFCAAGAILGIVVLVSFIPRPTVRSHNPEVTIDPARIVESLVDPGLARTTLSIFVLHYLLMSSFIVLPILMQSTGRIADEDHYLYYFWLLLAAFVAMLPFIYLADRKGLSKSMLLAMIAVFLGTSLSFSVVESYYPILITMVAFFMAFNLLESILPALVSKLAPAGRRGTAMGVFSTAQFAGGFFGGVAGGFLLGGWELADLMYANAAICIVWLVATIGMPVAGNYRTVTCRLGDHERLSTSEVADALLSVTGVVDVALLEDERLAYLKVDRATWDEAGLSRLAITAAPVAK